MEDLHRLYEHQTMVAIGMYSFLDNFLSRMPTLSESDRLNAMVMGRHSSQMSETGRSQLPPNVRELANSLVEFSEPDTFRARQERVRYTPRPSTRLSSESVTSVQENPGLDLRSEHSQVEDSAVATNFADPNEKIDVIAGGYPQEIFLNLSDHEKEEYMCAICYCVLKEAYQCPNEHRFCYGCIYTWSTGTGVGHDCCPVCRCDGLYAKNFTLQDKINRKRTRCTEIGCNWTGTLIEHSSHEHRYYATSELNPLVLGNGKKIGSKPIRTSTLPEVLTGNSSAEPSSDSEQGNEERDSIVPSYPSSDTGAIPSACRPLVSSLECLDGSEVNAIHNHHGLAQLQMYYGATREFPSPSQNERGRYAYPCNSPGCGETTSTGIRGNILSSCSTFPIATNRSRPASANRARYAGTPDSIGRGLLPRHERLLTPNSQRVQDDTNNQGVAEIAYESNPSGLVAARIPRLLPLRTAPRLSSESEAGFHYPANVLAPATASASNRGRMCGDATLLPNVREEDEVSNASSGLRRERVILPEINPGSLTNLRSLAGSCNRRDSNDNSGSQEEQTAPMQSSEGMQSRPLEFRRLAPRRRNRILEQLRETREQLAAMLRLMTLELEERRQQILTTALETASQTRALRSLNSQLATHLEESREERANLFEETVIHEQNRCVQAVGERQSNGLAGGSNALRNIPFHNRCNQTTHNREALRNLVDRILGNQAELVSRLEEIRSLSTDEGQQPQTTLTEVNERGFIAPYNSRLLARWRIGTMRRAPLHSVLLVSSRDTLGHLLSERREPQSIVNESSVGGSRDADFRDDDERRAF